MKYFWKILSLPFIGFLVYASFIFGSVPLVEGYHPIYPLIDTHRSSLYSIKKFDQVKINDSLQRVILLVGQPLYVQLDSTTGLTTAYFTNDGRLMNIEEESLDFAWYRSSVTLDSLNKVVEINKGWSHD